MIDDTNDATSEPKLRRAPLSQTSILSTAIAYVDENGLGSLSMRRLGRKLGVEAMALYRYFPNRDALLDAMVDHVVTAMSADPDKVLESRASWPSYLSEIAKRVRRIALEHPKLFPLVASQPTAAPWIRPPIRSLDWVESFMCGLHRFDINDADAVTIYRSFTSYLLGSLLLDIAWDVSDLMDDDLSDEQKSKTKPITDLSEYPTIQRLAESLSKRGSSQEFSELMDRHIASLL